MSEFTDTELLERLTRMREKAPAMYQELWNILASHEQRWDMKTRLAAIRAIIAEIDGDVTP